jgi:hypothetical protein
MTAPGVAVPGQPGRQSSNDFLLLQREFVDYSRVHDSCVTQAGKLRGVQRLLIHSWLAEVTLQLGQLGRMIAQLVDGDGKPAPLLERAWSRLDEIKSALSPAILRREGVPIPPDELTNIGAVSGRLIVVMMFLVLQLIAAASLVGFAALTFGASDPQTSLTREQWEERAAARAEVAQVRLMAEAARAADTNRARSARDTSSGHDSSAARAALGPDPARLRAAVEGLVANLGTMRLADRDLKLANRQLDQVLVALDDADFASAAKTLVALENALAGNAGDAPPSPILIILLGSVLGMLTITVHLNWKFRNRWDTVGFIPWYLTRLVAAPVISLAALGLLFQVAFTTDLTSATDITSLGLRGATPFTIFSVAIISGLFSNKVYDWLRGLLTTAATPRPPRPGTVPGNATTNPQDGTE